MNKVQVENLNFGETAKALRELNESRRKQKKKGLKRLRFEQLHFHNKKKILRNSSQAYVNRSKGENKVVDAKNFKSIDDYRKKYLFIMIHNIYHDIFFSKKMF